jgi:hypothetical protein
MLGTTLVSEAMLRCSCLMVVFLMACSSPEYAPLEAKDYPASLKFLRDGHTTKKEIAERLGNLTEEEEYEDGRIVIYINEYQYPLEGFGELVLVFEKNGVLKKHSVFLKTGN